MASKLQQHKIFYLLNTLSLGEIQSRTAVTRIVKPGRKPADGVDRRPIIKRDKSVKGTGIPASTLKRIKNLEIKPGPKTVKKIVAMYHRIQYHKLRAVGANYRNAKNFRTYPPDKVKKFISSYKKYAQKIQHNYETTYYEQVKSYEKQEREKARLEKAVLKKQKIKPIPEPPDEFKDLPFHVPPSDIEGDEEPPLTSQGVYTSDVTYLEDEELPDEAYEEPQEVREPIPDDYPTLDEVIFGMSESEHDYNEWDDIADTSGTNKK